MITSANLPKDALLQRYASQPECYTDCFRSEIARAVSMPEFVTAFYTSRLFRCERFILAHAMKRPSTDDEAAAFANGTIRQFAAWDLEDRTDAQLLACDMSQATRSWFKVEPAPRGTVLFFGSAVTPKPGEDLGLPMKLATPLHRLYSRLLLSGAIKGLNRDRY